MGKTFRKNYTDEDDFYSDEKKRQSTERLAWRRKLKQMKRYAENEEDIK